MIFPKPLNGWEIVWKKQNFHRFNNMPQRSGKSFRVWYYPLAVVAFISLSLLFVQSGTVTVSDQAVLSSGASGGMYYNTASAICKSVNGHAGKGVAFNLSSEGSTDNIQKLRNGVADLVIVQRDVLVDGYYSFHEPLSDISIIAPLFEEAIQIFVRHESESGVITVTEFIDLVKSGMVSKIAVGPESSTTSRTTKRVIELLGVPTPKDFYDHRPASAYIPEFNEGKIEAIAYFASIPVSNVGRKGDSISMLNLSDAQSSRVAERTVDLEKLVVDQGSYPWLKGSVTTVGTWALLVSRSQSNLNFGQSAENAIDLYTLLIRDSIIKPELIKRLSEKEGKGRIFGRFNQGGFFRGLPLFWQLEKHVYGANYLQWILLAIGILGGTLLIVVFKRRLPQWQQASLLWYQYQHISWVILIGVIMAYLMPEAIFWIERQFCEKYGLQSAILNLSYWEKYTWLLVLASTGYESQGFPLSLPARILASTTVLMYYFLGIFAVAFTYFKIQIRKKMIEGKIKLNWKEHIVVCGWNEDAPTLLEDLINESPKYTGTKPQVVLIHPNAAEKFEEINLLKQLHATGRFEVMSVEANSNEVIRNSNIEHARSVILLADSVVANADEITMMRALAIGSYCRRKNKKSALDSIYIIAEVKNPDLRETLLHNDVNEVICGSSIANRIVFQSAFHHGVNKVLDEVLDAKKGNEFYIIDVGAKHGKNAFLEGLKFNDLAPLFLEHGILLLGIKAKLVDSESGEEIFDEDVKRSVFNGKSEDGSNVNDGVLNSDIVSNNSLNLNREIMINPQGSEREYLIDDNDELFVIADGYKAITKAIESLDIKRIREIGLYNLQSANNPDSVIENYKRRQKKRLTALRGIGSII